MRAGGENGKHIEELILGYPSNPQNLIDDPENRTEIKSCQEWHKINPSRFMPSMERRAGHFKINVEQHQYLLEIDGYYLFVVQDQGLGEIIKKAKIRAREVEENFKFLDRKITKHHYFSVNWRSVFLLAPHTS